MTLTPPVVAVSLTAFAGRSYTRIVRQGKARAS